MTNQEQMPNATRMVNKARRQAKRFLSRLDGFARAFTPYLGKGYGAIRRGQGGEIFNEPAGMVLWPRGMSRWVLWPVLMTIFLFCQQWHLVRHNDRIDRKWRTDKVTGIHGPNVYDYGMYYWGLIPIYSSLVENNRENKELYSSEAAERLLVEHGESLQVEHYPSRSIRNGERTLKLAPLPLALIRGSPYGLGMSRSYAFMHALALSVLAFALWRYAPFPLCIVLPLILSSSEFGACEMYVMRRPLTVPVTYAAFSAGLLAPLIFERKCSLSSISLRLVLLAALFVYFMHIRNTVIPGLAAVAIILLLYCRVGVLRRLVLVGVFFVSIFLCSKAFDAWWNRKFQETQEIVETLGGQPYKGFVGKHHFVWSSIYIGFSDFDDQHGIRWNDWEHRRLYAAALKERGIDTMNMTSEERVSTRKPISRGFVTEKIKQDPRWFLNILGNRIQRILWHNEPPRINLITKKMTLPFNPMAIFVVAGVAAVLRLWGYIRLTIVFLPTVAVPLLCTTVGCQQYLSVSHLVLTAIGLTMLLRLPALFVGSGAKKTATLHHQGGPE